jgi:hypothetical protein
MTIFFEIYSMNVTSFVPRHFLFLSGYTLSVRVRGGDSRVKSFYIDVTEKELHNDKKLKKMLLKKYNEWVKYYNDEEAGERKYEPNKKEILGKVIDP